MVYLSEKARDGQEASEQKGLEGMLRGVPQGLSLRYPLNSWSEFGRLRAVIVGTPFGANHPDSEDPSFVNFFSPPADQGIRALSNGSIPHQVVQEIEEDISGFIKILKSRGVEVLRPDPWDSTARIKHPHFETDQLYSLMPRDCLLVIGDLVIEVPSPTRARYFETLPFRSILESYAFFEEGGGISIAAPKPQLRDRTYVLNKPSALGNDEPLFDGANVVRMGRDIFMDINNSANYRGYEWLQRVVRRIHGENMNVHLMRIGEDHADVTLVPLRPGVILVDPKRVNERTLPEQFRSWDQIKVTDVPDQKFGLPYPLASNGIGRNVFMLDESTAIVEENQASLIRELERRKFEVIPLRYRHGRTLGGSFHCITLDTHREGGMENYL